MDLTIGTFNLNNLFGRWNLYAEAPAPQAAVSAPAVAADPPRDWLEPAPALTEPAAAVAGQALPDVRITIDGEVTPEGVRWRTNPFDGRVVYRKAPEAQALLAERIKAMHVDVLAVQEVESIEALGEFVTAQGLRRAGYRHLVLVEGNDDRLIDVGVISRRPIGAVTSWRHRTYQNGGGAPVFSRDLLQVDVLSDDRQRVRVTLLVNHLKSKLARSAQERRAGSLRRRRQAETIAAVLTERPPPGPFVVLGDMNDAPTSGPLRALGEWGLVNALADPQETGGPYPGDDPDPPRTRAWTHRFRGEGRTNYELLDQIWLSPDLADKQTGAWIHRRTTRGGDGSDHDPAFIALRL